MTASAKCLRCGYSLVGLTVETCPECGHKFDRDDPRTLAPVSMSRWRRSQTCRGKVPASQEVPVQSPNPQSLWRMRATWSAEAAKDFVFNNAGTAPPGFVTVGDGPILGPHQ